MSHPLVTVIGTPLITALVLAVLAWRPRLS